MTSVGTSQKLKGAVRFIKGPPRLRQHEFLPALADADMLRLATIEDAETIATIHVCTWQTAYKAIVPAQFLAALSIQKRANMWRSGIDFFASVTRGYA